MLIIAIVLIGVIAVAGFAAFIVLCLGIRREDKAASLDRRAPGFAALQARRFTGWRAQPSDRIATHPASPDSARERARADA
jgi:hypothetical protein